MALCWCGFDDVVDGLLTCSVDGGEVDNDISGLEDEISEDSIDSSRSIWYEYASLHDPLAESNMIAGRKCELLLPHPKSSPQLLEPHHSSSEIRIG